MKGLSIVLSCVLVGCAPSQPSGTFEKYDVLFVEHGHSSTAPPAIPDAWHVAPSDFEFIVSDTWEIYDSQSGIAIRNFAEGRPRKARVELSLAERDSLFELLSASGFFSADPMVGKGSRGIIPPSELIHITVTSGGRERMVVWNPTTPELVPEMRPEHPRPIDPEEPGLVAFTRALDRMLRRRPAYAALSSIGLL